MTTASNSGKARKLRSRHILLFAAIGLTSCKEPTATEEIEAQSSNHGLQWANDTIFLNCKGISKNFGVAKEQTRILAISQQSEDSKLLEYLPDEKLYLNLCVSAESYCSLEISDSLIRATKSSISDSPRTSEVILINRLTGKIIEDHVGGPVGVSVEFDGTCEPTSRPAQVDAKF